MQRSTITIATALAVLATIGCGGGSKTSSRAAAAAVTSGTTTPVTTATPPTPPVTATTVTITPTPDTGKDAYVQSDLAAQTNNTGRATELLVGDAATLSADFRAFLEFGLTQVPAGSTVRSATLELFVTGSRHGDTDLTVRVHRVVPTTHPTALLVFQTPWFEGTTTSGATLDGLCWENGASRYTQPAVDTTSTYGLGATGIVAEAVIARGATAQQVSFDLTPLVAQWISGAAENHGLRLSHATEGAPYADGAKVIASSDDPDPTKRPRLIVTFDPPAGQQWTTLQPDAVTGKDVYVRNEGLYNNDNYGNSDLQVGQRTQNQLGDRRSYIQFDLSQVPAGATIVKATLELFHHGTSWTEADVTIRALRVLDTTNKNGRGGNQTPWVEGAGGFDATLDGMAWEPDNGTYIPTSGPADYIQPDIDESTNYGRGPTGILDEKLIAANTQQRWYAFDVTEAVKAWRAGAPNHGLRLMHTAEGAPFDRGTKHFVSSDMVHLPNHRPILRIEYR
jgi:hypothetical protein